MRGELEFRCFCHRRPLLAVMGREERTNQPYVHVKAWKSAGAGRPPKLFAEVVASAGTVRIRCRECFRWHAIVVRRTDVDFRAEPLPETMVLAN